METYPLRAPDVRGVIMNTVPATKDKLLVALLSVTGSRVGETLQLRLSDVDSKLKIVR